MFSKKLKMKRKGLYYYLEHTVIDQNGSPSADQDPGHDHAHCRVVISRDGPTGDGWPQRYSNPSVLSGRHLEVVHTRTITQSADGGDPVGTCAFVATDPPPVGVGASDEVNYCICGDRTQFPCGATEVPDCSKDPIQCVPGKRKPPREKSRPAAQKKKRPAAKRKR